MKKRRESNFELLRIVAMLMIITGHTISWGGIEKHAASNIQALLIIVYAFIIVEVNLFLLLTGYFQSKSKFKFDKFMKLLLLSYFYKTLITYICYKLGYINLSRSSLMWSLSPFDFSNYWFIKIYLVLYCLSPFLNKLINSISKRNFINLLIVLFVFCSILTSFTDQEIFTNSGGYSLVHFIFMYLIGAYISKYVLTKDKIKKLYSNKKELVKSIYIALSLYFLSIVINYVLYYLGIFMIKYGGWFNIIGTRLKTNYMHYDNPFIIIGSIGMFSFFALIKVKSKFINILSSSVFAVYLIHETAVFRPVLYSIFRLNTNKTITSYKIIVYIVLVAFIVFIACTIIEYIRRLIFFVIIKLFSKIKLLKKIKNKYSSLCLKVDKQLNE